MTKRRDLLEVATDFLDTMQPDSWARRDFGIHYAISEEHAPDLADQLQDFIANVIALILDAGSERDAVNENDELRDAIVAELDGWVVDSDTNEVEE